MGSINKCINICLFIIHFVFYLCTIVDAQLVVEGNNTSSSHPRVSDAFFNLQKWLPHIGGTKSVHEQLIPKVNTKIGSFGHVEEKTKVDNDAYEEPTLTKETLEASYTSDHPFQLPPSVGTRCIESQNLTHYLTAQPKPKSKKRHNTADFDERLLDPKGVGSIAPLRRQLLRSSSKKSRSKTEVVMKPTEFKAFKPQEEAANMRGFVEGLREWEASAPPCCLKDQPAFDQSGRPQATCRACTNPGLERVEEEWGRCAVVGLADTLLDKPQGQDIDAHDTVIRFGYAPTKGYEAYTGTKTDVTIVRQHSSSQVCKLAYDVWGRGKEKPSKAFLLLNTEPMVPGKMGTSAGFQGVPTSLQSHNMGCNPRTITEYQNVPVIFLNDPGGEMAAFRDGIFKHLATKYGKMMTKRPAEPFDGFRPTSGYMMVWGLYAAKVCSQIDLYGFSNSGWKSHYFAFNAAKTRGVKSKVGLSVAKRLHRPDLPLKPSHVLGAEHYIFSLAMANNMLCLKE